MNYFNDLWTVLYFFWDIPGDRSVAIEIYFFLGIYLYAGIGIFMHGHNKKELYYIFGFLSFYILLLAITDCYEDRLDIVERTSYMRGYYDCKNGKKVQYLGNQYLDRYLPPLGR